MEASNIAQTVDAQTRGTHMTTNTASLAALIAEFRNQVANYEILMRDGSDGVESVRNSYGPALEALQSPPPARTAKDTAAALLYLLDFGNLTPSDEAILRAAISGLVPHADIKLGPVPLPDYQQDSLVTR